MTRYILMTVCTAALALGMAPMAQAQRNCPPGARDCGGPAPQYRPQKGDQPRGNTRMERQNPGVSQRSERKRPQQPPQGERHRPEARPGKAPQAHQPSRNPDGRNPDGRAPGHRAPQPGGPQPGGPQMGGPQTPPPDLRVGGRGDRGAPFRRAGSSRFPPPPPGQEYRVMPNGWLVLVNSDTLGIVSIVGLLSALVAR